MRVLVCLALLLVASAFTIQAHQFVVWGHWFDWEQIHHETFSIALGFGGVALLIVDRLYRVKRRGRS